MSCTDSKNAVISRWECFTHTLIVFLMVVFLVWYVSALENKSPEFTYCDGQLLSHEVFDTALEEECIELAESSRFVEYLQKENVLLE